MCSSIGKVFKFNISETVTAMQCHLLVNLSEKHIQRHVFLNAQTRIVLGINST